MKRKIIQIPIDAELLLELDELSRKEERSRADLIREACRRYLRDTEEQRLEREYIEGYKRIPEDPALGEAQLAMMADVLPPENW